jgi:anti-anti-sigma factor
MVMELTTERYKRCDLVKVVGRIDSQTAPQLEEAFRRITDAGRFRIVFDMDAVEFLSSAGLRAMIDTQKTCKRWNRGKLVLAGVPQRIYETLDLTGLIPLFNFFDDAVGAVGSF